MKKKMTLAKIKFIAHKLWFKLIEINFNLNNTQFLRIHLWPHFQLLQIFKKLHYYLEEILIEFLKRAILFASAYI